MPSDTINTKTSPSANGVSQISIYRDDSQVCSHQLEPGSYVLIGASAVCGITLPDSELSPIHCAIRWENESYCVEDWHSDGGVSVDGKPVEGEQAVTANSEIRFGAYRLAISDGLAISNGQDDSPNFAESEADSSNTDTEEVAQAEEPPIVIDSEAPVEASVETTEPRTEEPPRTPPPLQCTPSFEHTTSHLDPPGEVDTETVELLRAEVEQLQYELADRDLQLADLTSEPGRSDKFADEAEDDTLLLRLEDLLSELERNDERCGILEQLLQASEDKHRAEQEERRHLTEWVNDIEERLGDRESEWQAERDALTHRLESVLCERDELMQQLSEPRSGEAAETDAADEQLRAATLELRQQLHEAEDLRAQLEEALRERDKQLASRSTTDNALREEHLKLAQDRAALARQQAEMTAQLAATNQLPHKAETEIDCKLREFRQHLREIHNEEEQSPRTVSSRLARIWAKLEGNG